MNLAPSPHRYRGFSVGTQDIRRLRRPLIISAGAADPAGIQAELVLSALVAYQVQGFGFPPSCPVVFCQWGAVMALSPAKDIVATRVFLGTGYQEGWTGVDYGSLYLELSPGTPEYDYTIPVWEPGHAYEIGDKIQPTWNVTPPTCPQWPGYMEATADFTSDGAEPDPWTLGHGGLTSEPSTPDAWLTYCGASSMDLIKEIPAGAIQAVSYSLSAVASYRFAILRATAGITLAAAPVWLGGAP